jgi:hypothetical protein
MLAPLPSELTVELGARAAALVKTPTKKEVADPATTDADACTPTSQGSADGDGLDFDEDEGVSPYFGERLTPYQIETTTPNLSTLPVRVNGAVEQVTRVLAGNSGVSDEKNILQSTNGGYRRGFCSATGVLAASVIVMGLSQTLLLSFLVSGGSCRI